MKRFRKIISTVISLCMLVTLFSACTQADAPVPPAETSGKTDKAAEAPKSGEPVDFKGKTLDVLLCASTFCESIEPYLKQFESSYDVKLNYDLLGRSNFDEKIVIELSSGSSAHDVYYVFGESLPQYLENDWLRPIDDLIADKSLTDDSVLNMEDLISGPVEACKYKGSLYGIPVFSATVIMYYRQDYFEKAGISGPPKTWDELVEACKKLKAIGVEPLAMRGAKAFGGAGWHLPMLTHSFGGKVYKDYPNDFHPTVNSPEYVKAVQFYSDLLNNYGIKGATTCNYEDIILAVQQGTVGIWIDGAPLVKQYEDTQKSKSSGKIGYAVPPAGPKGVTAAQTTHLLAVNKNVKEKELAWKFIEWATSAKTELTLATKGTHVAIPRKSVMNDPEFIKVNNFGQGAWSKAYADTLALAQWDYYPLNKYWPEVSDIITSSLSEVFTGKDAQKAMDEANKKIDNLMKQEGIY